ncbi:protein apterous isoform X3 [Drosophila pseudoobscura]|uniref:Protein apterous isoform X3 n=1 Tax=Drosophila pseudoobscura pseudoobscura TaxID=46245 RepID=A0A6I8VZS0_DROPS|nr:protein apterous isoform X3 [Drosophila pseudoobscura]
MNASFHSYRDLLVAHPQDSSSPENFAPVVIGYRNTANNKDIVETSSNISSSHLSFMDESSNDFNNHQLIHPNSLIKVCGGCGDKISDRYLLYALDRYWHNGCLKCHCCGAMLAEVGSSCFTRRGLILCKKDYSRYTMLGASLVCEQDWHKLLKSPANSNGTLAQRKGKVGRPRRAKD